MPRTCTVCRHGERASIDRAILAAEPIRVIAERYGLSRGAVQRHATAHVPARLAESHAARGVADADRLLSDLAQLREDAARVYSEAMRSEDFGAAIAGVREQHRIISTLLAVAGKLAGEGPTIGLFVANMTPDQRAERERIIRLKEEYLRAEGVNDANGR